MGHDRLMSGCGCDDAMLLHMVIHRPFSRASQRALRSVLERAADKTEASAAYFFFSGIEVSGLA